MKQDLVSQPNRFKVGILRDGVLFPIFFIFSHSEKKNLYLHGTPVLYVDDLHLVYTYKPNEMCTAENFTANDVYEIADYLRHLGL